jgi:hypothetical protein
VPNNEGRSDIAITPEVVKLLREGNFSNVERATHYRNDPTSSRVLVLLGYVWYYDNDGSARYFSTFTNFALKKIGERLGINIIVLDALYNDGNKNASFNKLSAGDSTDHDSILKFWRNWDERRCNASKVLSLAILREAMLSMQVNEGVVYTLGF